jgi:hypothetical protein
MYILATWQQPFARLSQPQAIGIRSGERPPIERPPAYTIDLRQAQEGFVLEPTTMSAVEASLAP